MNILVIDDHPLARKGIISILSGERNIKSIREARNIKEALGIIEIDKPDVVTVDLKLGAEDGLELVSLGRKLHSTTKFIILTSYISQKDFLKAEGMGIDGYILKDALSEEIVYVIGSVMRGKKYYDPMMLEYFGEDKNKQKITDQLTEREREVFLQVGNGYTNDEIAKRLFISVNTVKKHISSILQKLNLEHRTQVVLLVNSNEYNCSVH